VTSKSGPVAYREIALALKNFATDHDGEFPNKKPGADYTGADDLTSGNKSNDAFWWLFQFI
jgi:hypothetical protein